jgi:hypothetical protein
MEDNPGNVPPPNEDTLDELLEQAADKAMERDSWMQAPGSMDVEYVSRKDKKDDKSKYVRASDSVVGSEKQKHEARLHEAEIKSQLEDARQEEEDTAPVKEVDYKFGDSGSAWRMTRLKNVYRQAKDSGRDIESVALELYGDLRDFDAAREEETEVDRMKRYGSGYRAKEKPTGELFQQRVEKSKADDARNAIHAAAHRNSITTPTPGPSLSQTELNKLKARLMKAKLKKDPEAGTLEKEYNEAVANSSKRPNVVVLNQMESRMLAGSSGRASEVVLASRKRDMERGQVEENQDMSVEDMLRAERRSKGRSEGFLLAERIGKDSKFKDGLDYLDENSERLAKRNMKSDTQLKSIAVGDFQKMQRVLDNCPLCHHEDGETQRPPTAPVVSRGTRTYLTLPTQPEISSDGGGAMIIPVEHYDNLLSCDDDEWEEIRNFMKCLIRMYHSQGRDVVFYENAAHPSRHSHAGLCAVPVPHSVGATAPAFFREAILSSDEEWSQHKKIIDTLKSAKEGGMGRSAFRRSFAKEMPYFHVWFDLDGGIGHIIEDEERWPKGDLFAREVLGGMMDVEEYVVRKQGRWYKGEDEKRTAKFGKSWRKFDWTRILVEES